MTAIPDLMFGSYAVAALAYAIALVAGLRLKKTACRVSTQLGLVFLLLGFLGGLGLMIDAWLETGQPPFKTLYQSLIFFSVCTALVFALAARRIVVMGLSVALFILAVLGYAYIKRDTEAVVLPPALQSVYFIPHVVVYFLGYAALFVSFVSSILYLIFPSPGQMKSGELLGFQKLNFNLFSYRTILFGYGMITAGLILGAIWAKYAWGDWWSWDPKENFALISWLIYGGYLHLRQLPWVTPKGLAWVSIVGFLAVMFTYLGVNYLPAAKEALHSYTNV